MSISLWKKGTASTTRAMDVMDLAQALMDRSPWFIARRILNERGVPLGHGREGTLAEIRAHGNLPGVNVEGLYEDFVEHVACGEKTIRVFDVGAKTADTLRQSFTGLLDLNRLEKPRTRASMRNAQTTAPSLVLVTRDGQSTLAVFESIVRRDERVAIDIDTLPEDAQGMFAGYDEILAIRSSLHQAYAVVAVPDAGGHVELRVDDMPGDNRVAIADHHQKLYAEMHKRSGSKAIFSAVDLFPAIKNLYGAALEGTVVELGFVTTTGSVKNERMKASTCLRTEDFHVGGIDALQTDIEPIKVTVRWQHSLYGQAETSNPELHLRGAYHSTGSGVFDATISRAYGYADYNLVRDKLFEYVPL